MSGAHHHGPGVHHHRSHGHHHHDHHGHQHRVSESGPAFALAVGLNVELVIIEVIAGFWSGLMALLAEVGHSLSDVLALLLA